LDFAIRLSQSVVISTINAAVEARVISSRKEERVAASKICRSHKSHIQRQSGELVQPCTTRFTFENVSYAQGMELLGAAAQPTTGI